MQHLDGDRNRCEQEVKQLTELMQREEVLTADEDLTGKCIYRKGNCMLDWILSPLV